MQFPISPVRPAFRAETAGNPEVHGQWLFVEYEWEMRFGRSLSVGFPEVIAVDLALRAMEHDKMRAIGSPHPRDLRPVDDLMLALSERWMVLCHDLVRATRSAVTRDRCSLSHRVRDLFLRLDLVRPVLNDQPPVLPSTPFWVGLAAGADQTMISATASRLVPRAICDITGSVVWWPVAPGSAITVEIRRRSLSDAFLAAFD